MRPKYRCVDGRSIRTSLKIGSLHGEDVKLCMRSWWCTNRNPIFRGILAGGGCIFIECSADKFEVLISVSAIGGASSKLVCVSNSEMS